MSADDSLKVRQSEAADAARRERPRPREEFRDVLRNTGPSKRAGPLNPAAKGPGLAGQPPGQGKAVARVGLVPAQVIAKGAVSAAALASSPGSVESLGVARAGMNVEASRLQTVRHDGHAQHEQRTHARMVELILKELTAEVSLEAGRAGHAAEPRGPGAASDSQGQAVGAAAKAGAEGGGARGGEGASKLEAAEGTQATRAQAAVALVERIELFVKSQRPALALTVGGGVDARVEVERTGPNQVALRLTGRKGPPSPEDVARIGEELRARGLKVSSLAVG